jgi:hypothetical protein
MEAYRKRTGWIDPDPATDAVSIARHGELRQVRG